MTIWLTQSVGSSVLTRTSSGVRMFSSWSNPSLFAYGIDCFGSATGSMGSHTFNALIAGSICNFSSKSVIYLSECWCRIYYLLSSWLLKTELSSVVDYQVRYAEDTERDKLNNKRRTTRQLLRPMVTVFKWTGAANFQTSMFVTLVFICFVLICFVLSCRCPNKLSAINKLLPMHVLWIITQVIFGNTKYRSNERFIVGRRQTLAWVLFYPFRINANVK